MDQVILESLKELYATSKEQVVIVDTQWNTLWSNREKEITQIREETGFPENIWENTERPVMLDGKIYQCHLLCNQKEEYRILTFRFLLDESMLDFTEIVNIVQGIVTNCEKLYQELTDEGMYDQRRYLNRILALTLRIYRHSILRQTLLRGREGLWRHQVFEMYQLLIQLQQKLRRILRGTVDIELDLCDERLFVEGDSTLLPSIVTLLMVQCIRTPEKRQEVTFRLAEQEGTVVLEISSEATMEDRDDLEGQLELFGSDLLDKELIAMYCEIFDIEMTQSDLENGMAVTLRIPRAISSGNITLMSADAMDVQGYFSPVPVMLSRFRYRDYF